MAKKRKDSKPGQGTRGPSKKPKKAKAAPLPEAPDDSDLEVSDEDVDFVDEYSQRLGFLTSLDRKQIDRDAEKGVDKKKQPKLPAPPAALDKADKVPSEDEESYEQVPRHKAAETVKERERADLLPVKVNGELVYRRDAKTDDQALAPVPAVEGITIQEDEPEEDVSPVVTDDDEGLTDDDDGEGNDEEEEGDDEDVEHDEEDGSAKERSASGAKAGVSGRGFQQGPATERIQRGASRQAELEEFQQEQERREELKQQIALAATRLLQDPEQHSRELQPLVQLVSSRDEVVARLAMLSLAAVFKDILPGYRIRPPTDKELSMAVSKEVKKLRDHESGLLRAYQGYLKALLAACNKTEATGPLDGPVSGTKPSATARVGVKCLAILLKSLAHFNHAFDILQAVVPRMVHRDEVIAGEASEAVRTVLAADAAGDGTLARDAVQLVADLVKRRKCLAPPQTVEVLLGLTLRSAKASDVKSGEQREYRSRKTRKKEKRLRKGEDEVSAAFRESQATIDAAQKRRMQSETLEALFEIFFRVLKQCTASGYAAADRKGAPMTEAQAAKKFPLLAPALQGLTRYAHLISVEYFSDLLTVMQQIGNAPGLPLHTRLQCILTASDILKGQGEALTVDRHHLYQALYRALGHSCLGSLEPAQPPANAPHQQAGSHSSGGARSPQRGSSRAKQGAGQKEQAVPFPVLLSRTAYQMLVEQARALDSGRMAAFALRLAGAARFLGPGGALGLLAVLERLLRQQSRLRSMLDMDAESPVLPVVASKDPHSLEDAARTALGSQLWELHALATSHREEVVRRAAKAVAAIPTDNLSGHHVPMFAVADGPPGVATTHLSSRERGSEGVHAVSPERSAIIDKLQGVLDAYFLEARGASESERDKDACSALAAEAATLLAQLQGAESLYSPPFAGGKPSKAVQKQKGAGAVSKSKQKAKQAPQQKLRLQKQGM